MFTDIQRKDIAYHIHAQTNLALHEKLGPTVMVRGEGCYTYDDKGRKFLDAMSGMWSATLGFSETRLIEAAERQMRKLPYQQNFAHRTSEPATERMRSINPAPCFEGSDVIGVGSVVALDQPGGSTMFQGSSAS